MLHRNTQVCVTHVTRLLLMLRDCYGNSNISVTSKYIDLSTYFDVYSGMLRMLRYFFEKIYIDLQ